MSAGGDPDRTSGSLLGVRVFGLVLLLLGGVVLYGTLQLTRTSGYSVIGPAAVPMVIALGLIALSVLFIIRTTFIGDPDLFEHVRTEEAATHWPTVLTQMVLLVAYVFSLGILGYIIATSLFIPVGARLLGSRKPARDVAVGVGLALVVYFSFTELLGLRLPAGLLEPVL